MKKTIFNSKILRTFTLVCLIWAVAGIQQAVAQQIATIPHPDKEKTVINGKYYYIHEIKSGETLYGIGKQYGIDPQAILDENPEAKNGFQYRQKIKIPAGEVPAETTAVQDVKPDTSDTTYYKVKEKQTLYAVSRMFDVSEEDIMNWNPVLRNSSIQAGQTIKIPKKSPKQTKTTEKTVVPPALNNTNNDSFIYHKAEKKETWYSIAKKYGVTVDNLVSWNPEVKAQGLKTGQTIKIRHLSKNSKISHPKDTVVTKKVVKISLCDSIQEKCSEPLKEKFSGTYNVALMLPLFLKNNGQNYVAEKGTKEEEEEEISKGIYSKSINFLEFYEGALLAIDSIKRMGLSVNLYVYDTQKDSNRVKEIVKEKFFRNMNLIIGPFYSEQVRVAAAFGKKYNIPVVSPLSIKDESILYTNPYLFQVHPSKNLEMIKVGNFLSQSAHKNIIFLYGNDPTDLERVKTLKNSILRNRKNKGEEKPVIKELKFSSIVRGSLSPYLLKNDENIVVVPSVKEALVSDVVSHLNQISKTYKIKCFGLSTWRRFRNIDQESYANIDLHYYTPFYIDYQKEVTKKFIRKFRETYKTEPYKVTSEGYNYGFLGYDIAYYFLSALGNYGQGFPCCVESYHPELMMSNFHFSKINNKGGYENTSVYIINHNKDFSITKVTE
ncbi:MAG: LysM peptidoglycan-binding domain-containing protein [Bacteroidota bacterium]|nr:LysM peptidoglycan-binding domain-containing protein [Bacteroidota bacterium]